MNNLKNWIGFSPHKKNLTNSFLLLGKLPTGLMGWKWSRVRFIPITIIAILFFTATSCKKDKTKTPEDYRVTIPHAAGGTQSLGLYLNGQPWVPDYKDAGNGVQPIQVSMYASGTFGIDAYRYMWIRGLKGNEDFDIYIPPPLTLGRKLLNSSTYPYPSIINPSAYGMYQIYSPSKRYMTNNLITGYIDIIRVDTIKSEIEATFEFEAVNTTTNEKVKITNGYFKKGYNK